MILNLFGSINQEMLDKLTAFLNTVPEKQPNSMSTVYLHSTGGEYWVMEAMLAMLHQRAQDISLWGYGRLYSSAFDLFFLFRGEKALVHGTVGMYHQASMSIYVNENAKPETSEDYSKKKFSATHLKGITEMVINELKFTEVEIKKINNGKDVYFQPERMKEFMRLSNSLTDTDFVTKAKLIARI